MNIYNGSHIHTVLLLRFYLFLMCYLVLIEFLPAQWLVFLAAHTEESRNR